VTPIAPAMWRSSGVLPASGGRRLYLTGHPESAQFW
jgi:hypothetical protein